MIASEVSGLVWLMTEEGITRPHAIAFSPAVQSDRESMML